KTVGVANFQRMPLAAAVDPLRQQLQECREVVAVHCSPRFALPDQRPQAVTEMAYAVAEVLDLPAGSGQLARGDDALWRLGRKHETFRRGIAPAGIDMRLLRAVIRAVDLDAGQLLAGEFQFTALHQPDRIEGAATPRYIG